jgi:hypothetical protein
MEPRTPDDTHPLTVSFDEIQGAYRRRTIIAACVLAAAALVIAAAWSFGSLSATRFARPFRH